MKISYFPQFTAMQSEPIWKAFLEGCKQNNLTPIENSMSADAAVIWSVLWHGRMLGNWKVYNHYRQQNKPVFIIEVGSLDRGRTWKISINNVNNNGIYPDVIDIDRPAKLGIQLQPINLNRKPTILIAAQHPKSLQWANMPTMEQWIHDTVNKIKQHTARQIIVRPHPRWPINVPFTIEQPIKLSNTYDVYNIDYNHHCVVNYSSGPAIQAAIAGTPVVCDISSLAYPISSTIENIETAHAPDRYNWFVKLCHTEWNVDEIRQGIPQKLLLNRLTN